MTQYIDTLKLYEEIFRTPPPEDVWEIPEERFKPYQFKTRFVNFFRLSSLYSVKQQNPNFMQPSQGVDDSFNAVLVDFPGNEDTYPNK